MKGIILAGGAATRLYPLTKTMSKHLLPVYDKPMIYYPLSVLMLAGVREILIISTPRDIKSFQNLFGSGEKLGLKLSYTVQDKPKGIAEAFILGEEFIGRDQVCLILGDNIIYGDSLQFVLKKAFGIKKGARVFVYKVSNPSQYGVYSVNKGKPALVEKPKKPLSNWAVTGLYCYDNNVVELAKKLKPSPRGELEITDLNKLYLKKGQLHVSPLGRGYAWLDAGTYDSLLSASNFIQTVEERQGLKIGCVEEIAFRMGYINAKQLKQLSEECPKDYKKYLELILKSENQDFSHRGSRLHR